MIINYLNLKLWTRLLDKLLKGVEAGIKTTLTSHIARHTFAVCSIELGIPLEVISKILGHSDIKTTQIYAQIMNPVLDRWMENWNK